MRKVLAIATLLALGGAGAAPAEQELLVSGAASLTNAFTELGRSFEKANPGTRVTFNFAASGTLLQQIDKGAPVDVFASADQETMNQANAKRLLAPDTRRDFARNRLVLAVPAGSEIRVAGLKALARPEVKRVALGDPGFVPAGRYARQSLAAAGLWETLAAKLILANTVRQVLDYLARGEVDAGFVFATDVAAAKGRTAVVEEVQGHDPILYPIAVVAASRQKDLARKFEDFVLGAAGRAVLSKYGFGAP